MRENIQLHQLAGQIEWQQGTHREFLAALHSSLGKSLDQIYSLSAAVEFRRQFDIQEDPAPTSKFVSEVINPEHWSSQLATILCAPRKRVQARIYRARRSSPPIEVNDAEANNRAECTLPGKTW